MPTQAVLPSLAYQVTDRSGFDPRSVLYTVSPRTPSVSVDFEGVLFGAWSAEGDVIPLLFGTWSGTATAFEIEEGTWSGG